MKNHTFGALAGAPVLLAFSVSISTPALADSHEINQCIRHVAELERTVARQTEGDQRREILRVLSAAKTACTKGDIATAYQTAGKGLAMAKKTGS